MTAEDPLLAALADAGQRKQRADHDIRLLLAYAREHVQPDIVVGPLFALSGVGQRGEQRVLGGHDACLHFGGLAGRPEETTW